MATWEVLEEDSFEYDGPLAMADAVAAWSLSAATGRGDFQGTVGAAPYAIVSGTEKRDVSDVLDLLALADTPFINKIGWGPESGGVCIEWISEDLGPGLLRSIAAFQTSQLSIIANSIDGMDAADSVYQIRAGSVMYVYSSMNITHGLAAVVSIATTSGISIDLTMVAATGMGVMTTLPVNTPWYILGNHVNEGSKPQDASPRQRAITTNNFTILRQDVAISGSMKSTDMYAIGREDRHQILMRMKELQRQREMTALYSSYSARGTGDASTMYGVLGFLINQTGSHIDITTRVLTETAFNDVVGMLWDYGSENLSVFASRPQIAKFTQWDKNRIRQTVNEGKGGGYIKSYLTEAGVEVTLHPLRINAPRNLMFVLDTSQIRLRAKKGRKGFMEKMGKMGDSEDWQIISEFSMEMKGYNLKRHGMFGSLTQD